MYTRSSDLVQTGRRGFCQFCHKGSDTTSPRAECGGSFCHIVTSSVSREERIPSLCCPQRGAAARRALPKAGDKSTKLVDRGGDAGNECHKRIDKTDKTLLEAFAELAAIMEFDGGLSRDEAEALAWAEVSR